MPQRFVRDLAPVAAGFLAAVVLVACGDGGEGASGSVSAGDAPGGGRSLTVRHTKIGSDTPGFGGTLDDFDQFGESVAAIGDVDGDGVVDLAVGAIWDEVEGTQLSYGAVWIVFLDATGKVKGRHRIRPSDPDLPISGTDGMRFGRSVAGPGDLDGDGVPDLLVGAPNHDRGRGSVFVLLLAADGGVKSFVRVGSKAGEIPDAVTDGPAFGESLALVPDLDGDKIAEVVVGASMARDGDGALWLLHFDATGRVSSSRELSPFDGRLSSGRCGSSVAYIGDVDGDGGPELAVACHGAIGLVSLRDDGAFARAKYLDENLSDDRFSGYAVIGRALAGPGDVDGDGIPDLVVSGGRTRTDMRLGGPIVLFMAPDLSVTDHRVITVDTVDLTGRFDVDDRFGYALSPLGDFDGNGIADLAVGAPLDDGDSADTRIDRGAVWLLFVTDVGTSSTATPPGASTTTSSTTSTSRCPEDDCKPTGEPYSVEFHVLGDRAYSALQFTVDYSRTGAVLEGDGDDVPCSRGPDATAALFINDCDYRSENGGCRHGYLNVGAVSIHAFEAPVRLLTCEFDRRGDAPRPEDFEIIIRDAAGPNLRPLPATIGVAVRPPAGG